MDNTNAARQRRFKAHQRGDHSFCLAKHCPDAAKAPEADPGPVGLAVRAVVANDETAIRDALAAIAITLADGLDQYASAVTARELRELLTILRDAHHTDETATFNSLVASLRKEIS